VTQSDPAEPPPGVDPTVPSPARMWNYWIGGTDHYAADRAVGEQVQATMPSMPMLARYARRFLADAVRQLTAEHGIRQFLDIGTGLPTAGNTHQVAQAIDPAARVVYVDNDPSVLAQAGALLTSRPGGATGYVDADLRDVDAVLAGARQTLDFGQPIAVLFIAVLHFIPDADDPWQVVRRLMDAVPSGSYLVIAHAAGDIEASGMSQAMALYNQRSATPINLRTRAGVARFTDGLELAGPGLVPVDEWFGPGGVEPEAAGVLGGYVAMARKP
jgi:S-adenosyl methyltransferase